MNFMVERWNIEDMTGYTPITTFYEDFSIAEKFGSKALKETYQNALEYAKTDYKVLTELVLVLNWKIWRWWEENKVVAGMYDALWRKTDSIASKTLKGDELRYYYRTID